MYRRFLAAGMLAAVLLVSGCSNHATQNTEKTTQAVTESATGESTQTEQTEPASGVKETDIETKQSDGKNKQSEETQDKTSKESEQTAGEQTGDEELHTVIGTLEELGMDQVMLLSDNGNELIFSVEGVKIDLPSGIRIGNLIAVDYTGKINKKGTQKAAAIRIAGSADTVNVGETEKEENEENDLEAATEETTENVTEKVQASGKKKTLQGTMEKLSMTSLTLKDADGKNYTLPIINVPLYLENGLAKGTKVEVTYRGDLKGADKAEAVEVLKIQSAQ